MNFVNRRIKTLLSLGFFALTLISYNNCGQPFSTNDVLSTAANEGLSTTPLPANPTPTPSSGTPAPGTSLKFSSDIRPIIQNRCTQCHQPGGIAPFPLVNYSQVKSWGGVLLTDMQTRKMPPWGAKDDGSCQSFHSSMWMPQSEIDTFATWLNQSSPEGAVMPDIAAVAGTAHYNLNDSSVVEYKMPQTYTPANTSPTDEYRCFVTDEASVDRVITGFDIVVGNPSIVHHVIVYVPASEAEEAAALAKGPGYSCGAGPMVKASVAAFWAPGTAPTSYPVINTRQTGLRIPASRKLILQMHYNYAKGRGSDLSSIRFQTSASNIKEGVWFGFGKTGGSEVIPRGQANFNVIQNSQIGTAVTGAPSSSTGPGYIYAVFPHMHQLGSKIKIELSRDPNYRGSGLANECLVDVPAWDFHWQRIYWFKNPIPANSLDSVKVTCSYNTQGALQDTKYGEGSADEMCFMFAFVTDAAI